MGLMLTLTLCWTLGNIAMNIETIKALLLANRPVLTGLYDEYVISKSNRKYYAERFDVEQDESYKKIALEWERRYHNQVNAIRPKLRKLEAIQKELKAELRAEIKLQRDIDKVVKALKLFSEGLKD